MAGRLVSIQHYQLTHSGLLCSPLPLEQGTLGRGLNNRLLPDQWSVELSTGGFQALLVSRVICVHKSVVLTGRYSTLVLLYLWKNDF